MMVRAYKKDQPLSRIQKALLNYQTSSWYAFCHNVWYNRSPSEGEDSVGRHYINQDQAAHRNHQLGGRGPSGGGGDRGVQLLGSQAVSSRNSPVTLRPVELPLAATTLRRMTSTCLPTDLRLIETVLSILVTKESREFISLPFSPWN